MMSHDFFGPSRWSEQDLRRNLELAVGDQGRVDVAEGCRSEYGRRVGERRRIEDVEELEAQLQASLLGGQRQVLEDGKVRLNKTWSFYDVAAGVAVGEGRGNRERRG